MEGFDASAARLEKHSVTIAGHRTSLSLERPFWSYLKKFAADDGLSLSELIRQIDEARESSLSGAIRVFVLQRLEQTGQDGDTPKSNDFPD